MKYSGQIITINKKQTFQVDITRARKYYDQGRTLYFHPCDMLIHNPWQDPMRVNNADYDNSSYPAIAEQTFDQRYNEFKHYNCDKQRGLRVIIFVQTNKK